MTHPWKLALLGLGTLAFLCGCSGDPASNEQDIAARQADQTETAAPSAAPAPAADGSASIAPESQTIKPRRDSRVEKPEGSENWETWADPEVGHDDLPKHPMTIGEDCDELEISPVKEGHAGKKLYVSPWTKEPGYETLDDPERDATVRGRRIAEVHDKDFDIAYESLEDLVENVLGAAANSSGGELRQLMVTKEEFIEILWPEMPASRPALQIPGEDGWFFLIHEAEGAMAKVVREYGGQRYKALRVSFDEGVHHYTNFNIYSEMKIYATPVEGGPITVLDFCRSVVERNGRFKVYTYKD